MSGATRTVTPPALTLFTSPANGGNSTTGFTLKSEPAQEVVSNRLATKMIDESWRLIMGTI
jgi:hypothetical protein